MGLGRDDGLGLVSDGGYPGVARDDSLAGSHAGLVVVGTVGEPAAARGAGPILRMLLQPSPQWPRCELRAPLWECSTVNRDDIDPQFQPIPEVESDPRIACYPDAN